MHWILDFDDTLALGPNTWAIQTVLPQLIKEHQLPYDEQLFSSALLKAQEQANLSDDDDATLQYLFDTLNWDISLKHELIKRVFNGYQPYLFEDTLPFLEQRKQHKDTLLIVSNNNHAPLILEQLGIATHFTAIFTPQKTRKRPKPHAEMWQDVKKHIGDVPVHVIGDDPWSDGLFAQANPKATSWILDRLGRYQSLHTSMSCHFVPSLSAIPEG